MTFDPGVESMRAAGIPVTRTAYGSGAAGIRQSLETMALKMREGKIDARVIGWTGKVLRDAGLNGRDGRTTVRAQVTALLDAFRAGVVYAPDPYGTELVSSAAATLCLSPGLCLNRADCDDGVVAVGSATLSLGIPTQIIKQNYGPEHQEHVLLAVYDGNDWAKVDPSTNLPYGQAPRAQDEVWVDPMDPIGTLPEAKAEIVTLGRPSGLAKAPARRASPTPHWVGAGAVFGYPTVKDLIELTNTAAYNLQQLQAAVAACPGGFENAIEWTLWQRDFAQLQTDFAKVVAYVNAYIGDQPKALWAVSVVFYPWDQVRGIIDQEIDLDRRWRQFGGANCKPPEYPNEPQPSVDPDLWAMQAADTALKNVKAAADKATQPLAIGVSGVAIGIGLTIGGLLLLDRLLPRRR
jgi:hypothetical protein